ncbi:hypothetical protein CVV65_14520 [Kyrpidia spormannii]|uniref:Nudix hydrolase domain-containing protein n=1 Tax=Kyrpidia spormannii TaxID=2055160 RepID=A0A2K8NBJ8_9BACL|nr:hypothetical protein [Kyrpidia spormannii]ATY85990.1 hypothetical protein CVV65_14520 [Kyrpidia spormannii]
MNITNVQSQSHSPVRDAATVLPVRPDAGSGFLVYALRRHPKLRAFAGVWAFPGGSVEEQDRIPKWRILLAPFDERQATEQTVHRERTRPAIETRDFRRRFGGQDMLGEIMVVPAYTFDSQEYIAKLGRVYLDRPALHLGERPQRWTERLQRFLDTLEKQEQPDVVLLDSRSGLHDIAAALVTELGAHVLLFAADTEATWMGYRVLFRHWHTYGTARRMRNRLSLVAALVPPRRPYYLDHFREAAWDLFRDTLYDEVEDETDPPGEDLFSFDLMDDNAPHQPIPIYWNEGLAAVSSLQNVDKSVVGYAYQRFLRWFDDWMAQCEGAKP